jgi:FkbH-like protein
MQTDFVTALIVSSFNIENLTGFLNGGALQKPLNIKTAPFGQVQSFLLNPDNLTNSDILVIWTTPDAVIKSFSDAVKYKQVPFEKIIEETESFASLITSVSDKVKNIFIPSWVMPSFYRGYGLLDLKNKYGITNILMKMNILLAEKFEPFSNIFLMNTEKWTERAGKNAFNPKLMYMGKIAFGSEVFKEAAEDIHSALNAINGKSRKIIILDLDNTLWGGIVGDDGWENLKIGGHDPIGEAYSDFQQKLKDMTNRGILLGIASKNEESNVWEAFEKHPEMILKKEDFIGWQINWDDKSKNISLLLNQVNLGAQSAVFIDDNPFERSRISAEIPEILVPDWPEDPMLYSKALLNLRCFDTTAVTKEDLERTRLYVTDKQRTEVQKSFDSYDDWLKSLQVKVTIENLDKSNMQRTVQLLNKTNQMNLITRRLTEHELQDWLSDKENYLKVFRVSDKFGDLGLTGIISYSIKGKKCRIIDFILSCRIIGRKIEETMLYKAISDAKKNGVKQTIAEYIQTAKNKPCLEFWMKSGFEKCSDSFIFEWNNENPYPPPASIEIEDLS